MIEMISMEELIFSEGGGGGQQQHGWLDNSHLFPLNIEIHIAIDGKIFYFHLW